MITYVNTVLVSNLATGAVLSAAPAAATSESAASADAGKFIVVADDESTAVAKTNAANFDKIKVGIVTKNNTVLRKRDGSIEYRPIVKWSNAIQKDNIKSFSSLTYADDTEDVVTITFTGINEAVLATLAKGNKRVIVRLTFKDVPARYRKWTESYEYVTKAGDTATTIATGIAAMINKEYKRARVVASANAGVVTLTAMTYTDDNSAESINMYDKVRFNADIYYTDPDAAAFASRNKYFPTGVTIAKVPGKTYEASAKLVRDREHTSLGYQGIINHGEGTFPIIAPATQADLAAHYDAITLEFENMYRTADDLKRNTKESVEIYGITGQLAGLKDILNAFVTNTNATA
jgi:hypothetical protein